MDMTNQQIRLLETEAFAHGDALHGYLCRVALGAEYTAAELCDDSCLTPAEQSIVLAHTDISARAEVSS